MKIEKSMVRYKSTRVSRNFVRDVDQISQMRNAILSKRRFDQFKEIEKEGWGVGVKREREREK